MFKLQQWSLISSIIGFHIVSYIESEWKLLLNYIAETMVHCPAAFVSIPQPSSGVPNQDHGEPDSDNNR